MDEVRPLILVGTGSVSTAVGAIGIHCPAEQNKILFIPKVKNFRKTHWGYDYKTLAHAFDHKWLKALFLEGRSLGREWRKIRENTVDTFDAVDIPAESLGSFEAMAQHLEPRFAFETPDDFLNISQEDWDWLEQQSTVPNRMADFRKGQRVGTLISGLLEL